MKRSECSEFYVGADPRCRSPSQQQRADGVHSSLGVFSLGGFVLRGQLSTSKSNTTLNGIDTAAESGSAPEVKPRWSGLIHRGGPEGTELLHGVT